LYIDLGTPLTKVSYLASYNAASTNEAVAGRYTYKEHEQWNISFYAIVINFNMPLEAVHCHVHSIRYNFASLSHLSKNLPPLSFDFHIHSVSYS